MVDHRTTNSIKKTLTIALVSAGLFGSLEPPPIYAQDVAVPVALQIPLFMKVMSFDRKFAGRAGSSLVIAVVYQRGNRESTIAKDEALLAIAATPQAFGVSRRGVAIDLDARGDLAARIRERYADVVYVTPLRSADVRDIASAARGAGATTWTGVAAYMSQGIAVGVKLERDKPRIMINLVAARLQSCDFTSELLKLAQVL